MPTAGPVADNGVVRIVIIGSSFIWITLSLDQMTDTSDGKDVPTFLYGMLHHLHEPCINGECEFHESCPFGHGQGIDGIGWFEQDTRGEDGTDAIALVEGFGVGSVVVMVGWNGSVIIIVLFDWNARLIIVHGKGG